MVAMATAGVAAGVAVVAIATAGVAVVAMATAGVAMGVAGGEAGGSITLQSLEQVRVVKSRSSVG